jgi:hypothetical protein
MVGCMVVGGEANLGKFIHKPLDTVNLFQENRIFCREAVCDPSIPDYVITFSIY